MSPHTQEPLPHDTTAEARHVTDEDPAPCVNCGAPLLGPYCARCGQPVRPRVTLRRFFRRTAQEQLGVDAGLLFTARMLFRPARVVRDYLAGCTVRYAEPVRYLLICAAITGVLTVGLRIFDADRYQLIQIEFPGVTAADVAQANRVFIRWLNAFLILSVPITAALTRLFFPRQGLNYAEHLVFNAYVFAQSLLLMTVTSVPVFLLLGDTRTSRAASAGTWLATGALFFLYACVTFFRGRRSWVGLRAALALVAASMVYPPLMALGIALFVYLTR